MHKIALDRPVLPFQRAEGMSGVTSNIAVPSRAAGQLGGA